MARTTFDKVFGVGRRSWSVSFAGRPAADAVMARVDEWPRVGTGQATGIVVRHRGEVLSSPLWGGIVYHTFDRFRVARGGADGELIIEQTVAPLFCFLGFLLVAASYAGAVLGCIAAARGTATALLALVAPILLCLGHVEIGRQRAEKDCRDFLLWGVQQTPHRMT